MNSSHPSPAPSPCINVCVMDAASGWCTGCYRTMNEIASWGNTANAKKQSILSDLPRRESAYMSDSLTHQR